MPSRGAIGSSRIAISSGYPFETEYGYVRAVRVGPNVFVSGTTARDSDLDGDAETQMRAAIAVAALALEQAGAGLRHVVRTVVYVRSLDDLDGVVRAHRGAFSAVRPASTLVQVAALTPAAALVEIEITAYIDDESAFLAASLPREDQAI